LLDAVPDVIGSVDELPSDLSARKKEIPEQAAMAASALVDPGLLVACFAASGLRKGSPVRLAATSPEGGRRRGLPASAVVPRLGLADIRPYYWWWPRYYYFAMGARYRHYDRTR
jgi:hypothetical protein